MLSLFNPFTLKRVWDNYDSEFCSYMLQQKNKNGSYPYNYLDVIYLFSRPYFNVTNKELLKALISEGVSISGIGSPGTVGGKLQEIGTGGIDIIFTNQELVNRFKSIDPDLLKLLVSTGFTQISWLSRGTTSYFPFRQTEYTFFQPDLFHTQEQIDKFNSIDPAYAWLNFLFDKKIITDYNFANLLKGEKIDGLNKINFDLFSALIDGIINKSLQHNEELDQLPHTLHHLGKLLNNKRNIQKFNSINPDLLKTVVDVSDNHGFSSRLNDVSYFFDGITQEKLDRLCVNLDLLSTLAKKNMIKSAQSIGSVVACNEGDIEKLSNHLDLFTLLIDKNIIKSIQGGSDLSYFFYITRHNRGGGFAMSSPNLGLNITINDICSIDNLYSLKLDLLAVLIDEKIIKCLRDLSELCSLSEYGFKNLNSLSSGVLTALISKGTIKSWDDVYLVLVNDYQLSSYLSQFPRSQLLLDRGRTFLLNSFKKRNVFIANIKDNPTLTEVILKIDGLVEVLGANGIKELISHPQYAESSNYLLKNCQLALVLYQKGAIENITVDYLFDSTQIQSDVTEFLKDVELADASDNITLSMGGVIDGVFNVVNDNPMPTLGDLSLTAFAKTLPSVGTRRT